MMVGGVVGNNVGLVGREVGWGASWWWRWGWWAPLVEVGWGAHWVGTIRTLGAALQSGPALPRATTVHVGAR